MEAKKLLFLVMAICLASGVKAQFYDSADEIYYYVAYEQEGNDSKFGYRKQDILPQYVNVYVLNFDGMKAAPLSTYGGGDPIGVVKRNLKSNPTHYDDKVETALYEWEYVTATGGETIYTYPLDNTETSKTAYCFSRDRSILSRKYEYKKSYHFPRDGWEITRYKRVDKSYFKTGRSRTPSSGMYE
ncbi:MAG: hypothetical protein IJV34_04140 [Prevotella sp.]|nr:hypothetical protein [Prevotella sp.]